MAETIARQDKITVKGLTKAPTSFAPVFFSFDESPCSFHIPPGYNNPLCRKPHNAVLTLFKTSLMECVAAKWMRRFCSLYTMAVSAAKNICRPLIFFLFIDLTSFFTEARNRIRWGKWPLTIFCDPASASYFADCCQRSFSPPPVRSESNPSLSIKKTQGKSHG